MLTQCAKEILMDIKSKNTKILPGRIAIENVLCPFQDTEKRLHQDFAQRAFCINCMILYK